MKSLNRPAVKNQYCFGDLIKMYTVGLKWNATDKIWDFSTTDVVIGMNQSVVPRYSLGWFLWGGLQDIKCAWFSLEGFIFEFVNFELSQQFIFMEFEVGHLKEPFFLSRIPFFWWKNVAIFMSYRLWKVAILYILWHFYWKWLFSAPCCP